MKKRHCLKDSVSLEESDYDGSVALCQGIEFRVGQFRLEIHKGRPLYSIRAISNATS